MTVTFHGQFERGLGWIAEAGELIERSSTALAHDGRVWLIDPIRADGLDKQLTPLGKVAGVILTLARHDRDAAWLATLHGVPVYIPRGLGPVHLDCVVEYVQDRVPNSPLELVPTNGQGAFRWWKECGVWWPEQRTLVIGDGLGTAHYFLLPGERLAVHPFRFLQPPEELARLNAQRVYCGHGPCLPEAAGAVEQAVRAARSRIRPFLMQSAKKGARALAGKAKQAAGKQ